MSAGLADLAAGSYLAWGILKGRRRGLSSELPRLVSVTLALITGAGLAHWSARVMGEINKLTGQAAGAAGWGLVLVGAFYLARLLRARMGAWIEARWPGQTLEQRAGMIAGFLRTLVIGIIVTLFLLHTPLAPLVRNSAIGGIAQAVQPVYHIAAPQHNAAPTPHKN